MFMVKDLDPGVWGYENVYSKGKSVVAFVHQPPWKEATNYILISKFLVKYAPASVIVNTILHEIAHIIAGKEAGHSIKWLNIAKKIGYTENHAYEGKEWITKEVLKKILKEKKLTIPVGIADPGLLFEIYEESNGKITKEQCFELIKKYSLPVKREKRISNNMKIKKVLERG